MGRYSLYTFLFHDFYGNNVYNNFDAVTIKLTTNYFECDLL